MVLTIQREFPFVGKTKQLHAMEMYIDCMIAYTREHDLPTLKDFSMTANMTKVLRKKEPLG
jgi:hypothetical protein